MIGGGGAPPAPRAHLALPRRRIVELLRKDDSCWYEEDLTHAHQITQYIACHRTLLQQQQQREQQGAAGAVAEALRHNVRRWHLLNFGFDPLKELLPEQQEHPSLPGGQETE